MEQACEDQTITACGVLHGSVIGELRGRQPGAHARHDARHGRRELCHGARVSPIIPRLDSRNCLLFVPTPQRASPVFVVELNFEQKTTATECRYKPHTRYPFVFDFDV